MRICYVILTCQKYVETRVAWQRETCLSSVPSEDIVYLGHERAVERRLFSWGAGDEYRSLPHKLVGFFQNYVPEKEWDWYVFLDDDTYVDVERLHRVLSFRDPRAQWSEGHLLTHIAHTEWGLYHSGGAGTVLSQATVKVLSVVMRNPVLFGMPVAPHWCADICLGIWVKRLSIPQIHHPGFHPEAYREGVDDLSTAITFHHLKTREDFLQYQRLFSSVL